MHNNPLKLFAPATYWEASSLEHLNFCNGCGPKGIGFLIPNKLFGIDFSLACNIHDWMYAEGKTIEDKESADRVFLNNMVRLIDHSQACRAAKIINHYRAKRYYLIVKNFAGPSFWADKNNTLEYRQPSMSQ